MRGAFLAVRLVVDAGCCVEVSHVVIPCVAVSCDVIVRIGQPGPDAGAPGPGMSTEPDEHGVLACRDELAEVVGSEPAASSRGSVLVGGPGVGTEDLASGNVDALDALEGPRHVSLGVALAESLADVRARGTEDVQGGVVHRVGVVHASNAVAEEDEILAAQVVEVVRDEGRGGGEGGG
mgnify:CR=1 FL=1